MTGGARFAYHPSPCRPLKLGWGEPTVDRAGISTVGQVVVQWTSPTAEPGDRTSLGLCVKDDPVLLPYMNHVAKRFDPYVLQPKLMLDHALLTTSGRWLPGGEDPDTLVPGDVGPVRAIVAGSLLQEVQVREQNRHFIKDRPELLEMVDEETALAKAQVSLLYEAVPFFLDGDVAVGLLNSDAPQSEDLEDIHLPFPVVAVYFGNELEIPLETIWPSTFADDVDRVRNSDDRPQPPWSSFALDIGGALYERGGRVTGVILCADDDGGVHDVMCWIVSAEPDEHVSEMFQNDRQRCLVIGRRSLATWGTLTDNLIAGIRWLPWTQNEPLDLPDPDTKEWRKATNRGVFRRREPRGGALGVNVIDIDRTQKPAGNTGTSQPAARSSPHTHLRRGHWRRNRVGPRDDWTYKLSWIAPLVVNPGGNADQRLTVYRLPNPDLHEPQPANDPAG